MFTWDSKCEEAFKAIRESLISASVLSCPDFNLSFKVQCDASDFGLGAVLCQIQNRENVLFVLCRSLNKSERRYSTTVNKCIAVLFAIEKLRPYLEDTQFTVITDHFSLKWLNSIKALLDELLDGVWFFNNIILKLCIEMEKKHVLPDALSRSVRIIDSLEYSSESLTITSDSWYLKNGRQVDDGRKRNIVTQI